MKPEEGSLSLWDGEHHRQLQGFSCGHWCEEKGLVLAQNGVFGPAEEVAGSGGGWLPGLGVALFSLAVVEGSWDSLAAVTPP